MSSSGGRLVHWRRMLLLSAAAVGLSTVGPGRAAETIVQPASIQRVTVNLDAAKLIKLPERTVTLVIGNPLIADAAVQAGGTAVITAKSYGMTNIVALDRTGAALAEFPIQVIGPGDATVVLYRGTERETYSCMPNCERRITLGDSPAYLTGNLQSLTAFTSQAQGGVAGGGGGGAPPSR